MYAINMSNLPPGFWFCFSQIMKLPDLIYDMLKYYEFLH